MADNKKMILNLFAGVQDALFLGDRFSQGSSYRLCSRGS